MVARLLVVFAVATLLLVSPGCRRGEDAPADEIVAAPVTEAFAYFGTAPDAESPEVRATIASLHRLASAVESYEDVTDAYPDVARAKDLADYLVPTYLEELPLTDGWGREWQVKATPLGLEIRSLGSDGALDGEQAGGGVSVPGADIVFVGESFTRWPVAG